MYKFIQTPTIATSWSKVQDKIPDYEKCPGRFGPASLEWTKKSLEKCEKLRGSVTPFFFFPETFFGTPILADPKYFRTPFIIEGFVLKLRGSCNVQAIWCCL